jgi:hypothetical protein
MSRVLERAVLLLVLPLFCPAQPLSPLHALDRYLEATHDAQPGCSDLVFAVQIDASLPKLKKQGSMSGFRFVSRAGQIVYRGLRFTGDNLVKTNVIARFLANDADGRERAADTAVTRQNYTFVYQKAAGYNGLTAYVFRLTPRQKRPGLFKGELWLEADTAAPLRLWGDLVKSPSIFVRGFRFVQDYQNLNQCSRPLRVLLTIQTRLAGEADMAMWLHPVDGEPAAPKYGTD